MKHLLSFVQYEGTLNEYENARDLQKSLAYLKIDGFELAPCDLAPKGIVTPKIVKGVHVPVYADWLGFYLVNGENLEKSYGSQEQ